MIVQCDFDGTIIEDNLSVKLRQRFADKAWQRLESQYMEGRFTVEQSNIRQYLMIKEPEAVLQDFVRQNTRIRAGFPGFIDYCREIGVRFVIVSSGIDFYIKTALETAGLAGLELYCSHGALDEGGIRVSYLSPEGNIIDSGFKESYLRWLKSGGDELVYIGDGLSDLDAALKADYVFATGHLAAMLEKRGARFTPFHDFHDIQRDLQSLSISI